MLQTDPVTDAVPLLAAAHADADRTVDLRRRLHRRPEVGLQLPETQAAVLEAFAERCAGTADRPWEQEPVRRLRQNALRVLIATSPDLQTS